MPVKGRIHTVFHRPTTVRYHFTSTKIPTAPSTPKVFAPQLVCTCPIGLSTKLEEESARQTEPASNLSQPVVISTPDDTLQQDKETVYGISIISPPHPIELLSIEPLCRATKILVQTLQAHAAKGQPRPLRSIISLNIAKNGLTYKNAGVAQFSQYAAFTVKDGIVELEGLEAIAWITLKPAWLNVKVD